MHPEDRLHRRRAVSSSPRACWPTCSLPRAGTAAHRVARHRPRAARHGRAAAAAYIAGAARRRARGSPRTSTAAPPWTDADFVINIVQVGMDARDPHRLRDPRPLRPAPDHRRHARRRRHLPRAAHLPGAAGARRGHRRGLPGRVAAELHQPDGDERPVPGRGLRARKVVGPVPLGLLDDARPLRAGRRPATRRSPTGPPGSTTRRGCCGSSTRRQDLYPRLDAAIAADPELRRRVRVDMYRRLGYYPTETSEHSSEYVPWYLHHRQRGRAAAAARGRLSGDRRGERWRRTSRPAKALTAGEPLTVERTMEYAPQVIHSIVTGHPAHHLRQRPNRGLIGNLPAGGVVEVPCLVDGSGSSRPGRRAAAAVRRAQPHLPQRERPGGEGRDGRRSAPHPARRDGRPGHCGRAPVERIWDLCDELVVAHGNYLAPSLRAACR